jgi:GTPase SAR1 family protein
MRTPFFNIEWDTDSDEEEEINARKIFVLGDKKVGKSMFINRLVHNSFTLTYIPTRAFEIHDPVEIAGKMYQLWEIPTDQLLIHGKYVEPDIVILMFDPKRPETLKSLTSLWEKFIKMVHPLTASVMYVVAQIRTGDSVDLIPSICPRNKFFIVNNCSTEGIGNLMYNIHNT